MYGEPDMSLINDPNYCDFADAYNLLHPENVLNEMNFLTDYNFDGLARKNAMKEMGNDVLPDDISKDMPKKKFNERVTPIPINTTMIFTKRVRFHYWHEFGKDLFCLSQM